MEPTTPNFAANKLFTMAGVTYKPGDPVDISGLPDHKVKQFLNQRILRPSAQPQANDA